jgi:hypothetical protein
VAKIESQSAKREKAGTYMKIGCAHAPFHNKKQFNSTFKFLQKEGIKLQGLVLNGDFLDLNSLSSHDKGQMPLEGVKLGWEYREGAKLIKELESLDYTSNATFDYIYGNHCISVDNQVLTNNGWKYFKEVTDEDLIAQFDENRNISYAKPERVINYNYSGLMYTIENRFSRQVVTADHKVVLFGRDGMQTVIAKDLFGGEEKLIASSGFGETRIAPHSIDYLRLLTNVIADGCVVSRAKYGENTSAIRIQFKLSKQRKIDRLEKLLNKLNIPYTKKECKKYGVNKLQPYYIRIYGQYAKDIYNEIGVDKQFPEYFKYLDRDTALAIVDELSLTDGTRVSFKRVNLSCSDIRQIESLSMMALNSGINFRTKKYTSSSGFKKDAVIYRITFLTEDVSEKWHVDNKITAEHMDCEVFCFTMPLGTLITRSNGKVAFTGNCDRYFRRIKELESHKVSDVIPSPEQGLGLDSKWSIHTNWKEDFVKLGKYLNVFHGEFTNIHTAKKHLDTYRESVAYNHTHRYQVYVEGMMGAFNGGFAGDIDSPVFGYATRAMKRSWMNNIDLIHIDKDGYYHMQPLNFINNQLIVNGRKY